MYGEMLDFTSYFHIKSMKKMCFVSKSGDFASPNEKIYTQYVFIHFAKTTSNSYSTPSHGSRSYDGGFWLIVTGSSGKCQPPTRENDHRSSDRYQSKPVGNVPSAALLSISPGLLR